MDAQVLKACTRCGQVKPMDGFHYDRSRPGGRRSSCKECDVISCRDYRANNPDRVRGNRKKWYSSHREKVAENNRAFRERHRAKSLVKGAKSRASAKGIAFELGGHIKEIQSRLDMGICEMTGLSLDLRSKKRDWNSPSIDRIDANGGYTYSNIRIVCLAMNSALGWWGEDRLRAIVLAWLEKAHA